MEQIVIDSGVTIKWYIGELDYTPARLIRDDYEAGLLGLLAPDLIYSEVGNIVWKKHLFHALPEADAQNILTDFRDYLFKITPARDLLDEAYQLAVTYRRSVYDSLYLALSLRAGCRFVTADEKFVNAVGAAFPNVVWLANWP